MYLDNKYTKWYFSIISNARVRDVHNEYTEVHHIIPKSLNGTNESSNLVRLTAKEHFICHMLLTKMVEGPFKQKMIYAWWAMSNQKRIDQYRYKVSSGLYKIIKEKAIKNHRLFKHTDEHKQKVSDRHKGKVMSEETKRKISQSMKGRKLSKDHYNKLKEGHKLFKHTDEHKQKVSDRHKGKKLSQETKEKISASQKNRLRLKNVSQIEIIL